MSIRVNRVLVLLAVAVLVVTGCGLLWLYSGLMLREVDAADATLGLRRSFLADLSYRLPDGITVKTAARKGGRDPIDYYESIISDGSGTTILDDLLAAEIPCNRYVSVGSLEGALAPQPDWWPSAGSEDQSAGITVGNERAYIIIAVGDRLYIARYKL